MLISTLRRLKRKKKFWFLTTRLRDFCGKFFAKIAEMYPNFCGMKFGWKNHLSNQLYAFSRQTARPNVWLKSEIVKMPNSLIVWTFSKCGHSFQNYSMFLPSLPTDFPASKNFDFWLLGCVILKTILPKMGQISSEISFLSFLI